MICQPSLINGKYPIKLPHFRHDFHTPRPGWEAERLASCHDLMKPGDVVFDIGAECGDFTALYSIWTGDQGKVIPFEPAPMMWPSIRCIFEGNDLQPPKGYFAGFVSDETDLHPPQDNQAWLREPDFEGENRWPLATVRLGEPEADPGFRHLAQQTIETPQITLDYWCERFSQLRTLLPDSIVMDIEGAEYRALLGARRLLTERHPIMWVSIHPGTLWAWYQATREDIISYMRSVGYDDAEKLGEDSEEYWIFR